MTAKSHKEGDEMSLSINLDRIVTPMDIARRYTQSAPVDLEAMARALGIRVDMNAHMSDPDTSGLIKKSEGGEYRIEINANDPAKRKKFTLAHEISHYLLHRDMIDRAAVIDNGMYRSSLSNEVERQANRLAAELLMPEQVVRKLWNLGVKSIGQLSGIFHASEPAVRIRLEQLGYPV